MCQDQTNKYGIIIILPNWRNHTKCNIWLDWTNNRRTCAKWPFSAQIALWYSDSDTTIAHLTVNRVWRWANSIRLPRPQSVKSTYRIFNFFFNHCASGCECDENPYVAFRIFFLVPHTLQQCKVKQLQISIFIHTCQYMIWHGISHLPIIIRIDLIGFFSSLVRIQLLLIIIIVMCWKL